MDFNWRYYGEEVTDISFFGDSVVGFVYLIVADNGKRYIGKKNLRTRRKRRFGKRETQALQDKRLKTWEWVVKESDWKTYTGSCKPLNEDIKNGVKVSREILALCISKKELSYEEAHYQFKYNVLRNKSFYNDNIQVKVFSRDLEF